MQHKHRHEAIPSTEPLDTPIVVMSDGSEVNEKRTILAYSLLRAVEKHFAEGHVLVWCDKDGTPIAELVLPEHLK